MMIPVNSTWACGVLAATLVSALSPSSSAQVTQLTREQSVRMDVAGFEPRLDWMIDEPPVIDKQRFRQLQSEEYAPDTVFVRFMRWAARESAGSRARSPGCTK
jgi:hypothetical protein